MSTSVMHLFIKINCLKFLPYEIITKPDFTCFKKLGSVFVWPCMVDDFVWLCIDDPFV